MSIARREEVPVPGRRSALEEVRAGFGLLRIEFRRSFCLWLFPFMAAALAWVVYEPLPAGVWLWTETVWSLQSSLILFGPLVGGLAVWVAGREMRRDTGDLLSTTARPGVLRDLALWAATAAWCVLAYGVVAAAFLLLTLRNATWGSPEPGPVLVGLLAVVTHSALGYAVGSYLPSRFVAPLFAISMYWIQGIMVFGPFSSLRYLSPLGGDAASSVFYNESRGIFAPQSLWLLGLAATALTTVALKRRKSTGSWTALAATAAAAAVGAVAVLGVPVETVDARGALVPYQPVCEEGEIPVCVHPAYEVALPETARAVNDLVEPLVGIPGAPTRAEQRGDAYPSRLRTDGTLVFDMRSAFIRWNVNHGSTVKDQVGFEVPSALVSGPSGYVEGNPYKSSFCREAGDAPGEAQRVIAAWLSYRAGDFGSANSMAFREAVNGQLCPRSAAVVERFDALTPAERRAWLETNYADLRAGELTLEDLP